MKQALLYLFLLLGTGRAFGQAVVGSEKIPAKNIKPWLATTPKSFEGVYHFGESEGESELALAVSEGIVTAQIKSGDWVRVKGVEKWRFSYKNLTNVKIEGNKFRSVEMSGEFVRVLTEGNYENGLKINQYGRAAAPKGEAEIGTKSNPIKDYYQGEYPQASYQVLQVAALNKYSKAQLVLMRNEVFARYGYIFSTANGMLAHFKKQDWYDPSTTDVSRLLTEIEKKNIALLKASEAKM
ncbi:YARHG domain-containing protein [Hymenobacter negativus]|uniref:YARHG domain-containing protein n=1 Tax=Hymenobacter negativus TaxID=2795026 RepID=A0ABS3QDZ4_9BACT|nr:YARHG domain-containing protein [Hymenobacter negativus]MBO2009455.1 YARHG domain-containing protein [Hymenobacter negativus]